MKYLKLFLFNLVSVFVLLIVAEIILHFIPVVDPYTKFKQFNKSGYIASQFPPNLKLQYERLDSLPGFEFYPKQTTFSINSIGFRGPEINKLDTTTYRIFCIGGSTTECGRLQDGDDWPSLLRREMPTFQNQKVEVQNCGKSGDNLKDHATMLLHRISLLNPDMVILYAGINDLRRSYFENNPLNIETNNIYTIPKYKMFLSEFQLYRRFYNLIKRNNKASTESIFLQSHYKQEVENAKKAPASTTPPPIDYDLFKTYLNSVIGICRTQHIRLIVVTQKTNWETTDSKLNNWIYMHQIGDSAYSRTLLQHHMNKLNQLQKEVCAEQNIEVFDASTQLPGTAQYFYDDCHFNPEGSIKMALLLLPIITNTVKYE